VKSSLGVSESTLYPVMRRLQTDDCLSVYDMPHNGRNRRYYKITARGRARAGEVRGQGQDFKQKVDSILSEPRADGGALLIAEGCGQDE
jgi:PadR family transcriptional regulator PadR